MIYLNVEIILYSEERERKREGEKKKDHNTTFRGLFILMYHQETPLDTVESPNSVDATDRRDSAVKLGSLKLVDWFAVNV